MKYQYSVIGDNTRENREWLEKVGYKFNFVVSYVEFDIIYTWKGEMFFIDKIDVKNLEPSLFINCIGNPQLFKAVSAMREDSDYGQWFTDGKMWVLCKGDRFSYWYVRLGYYIEFSLDTIHKATLTELQEKFKL